ncbi:type II toxin-antitoxin system VapC family toxin [Dyadobacter sp. NIV53]|uniref:type II toxin-antitoxin system VapC family toxin n=1 Tax=Dyadobacter sp. NIV53 TaxID=2861765 RepID=UPI001C883CFB|nr:type II toxin-antitoxin system VapC family toxin [Dyadobacter sp. NIV53]
MEQRFLMDSNAVIDYIAKRIPSNGQNFINQIIDEEFLISSIVKIEVLGFNESIPARMLELKEFISLATLLSLNDSVIEQTIELRKNYQKLKLGDAIIAATALIHNLTVITRNTNDFKNINGLVVLNPHQL